MKSTHNDLCVAVIAIGAEPGALESVRPESFHRLAELGLAQWGNGEWELTPAGNRLLRPLLKGDEVASLE